MFRESCTSAVLRDRDGAERLEEPLAVARAVGHEVVVEEVFLDQDREQRTQTEGVSARTNLEMMVCELRGLGATRVDDDQGSLRVRGDLAEDRARAREAMGLPGVLADEYGDLGALEVAGRVAARAAVELAVDPELPRLLLSERVRRVDRAQRLASRGAVGAAEMVPLAAAAVVEDRLAAVGLADRGELRGDLADGGVPVDRLEGAVGASPEGRLQAVPTRLVVVEPLRLLAGVALRPGVRAIAANAGDVPAVDLDLDAAVDAAEDAGGPVPLAPLGSCLHGGLLLVPRADPSAQRGN